MAAAQPGGVKEGEVAQGHVVVAGTERMAGKRQFVEQKERERTWFPGRLGNALGFGRHAHETILVSL